jgi:hypothetical protein
MEPKAFLSKVTRLGAVKEIQMKTKEKGVGERGRYTGREGEDEERC